MKIINTTDNTIQEKLNYVSQLSEILNEDISSVIYREQFTIDSLTNAFQLPIILFGAGNLGRKILAGLKRIGIQPLAFADNNPTLWGTIIDSFFVYSPEDAARRFRSSAVFMITIWNPSKEGNIQLIYQQLKTLGCDRIIPFGPVFWKFPNIFLPHPNFILPSLIFKQKEDVISAMLLLADTFSKIEYYSQIKLHTHIDFRCLLPSSQQDQYFPEDLFDLKINELFIDCGAYNGDTIKVLLRKIHGFIGEIHAIEPDPQNYQRLNSFTNSLKSNLKTHIHTHQYAIRSKKGRVKFIATGTQSAMVNNNGEYEVDCISLNELLECKTPTIIKMDIEGSEPEALMGAQKIISNHLPILAICVYHQPDHLWKIPLLINSISKDYYFFLRRYSSNIWDTVCYAIPEHRLKEEIFTYD